MAEKKRKHFNKAIVFGSVLATPEIKYNQNGKPFTSFQLQCPNDLHGNVRPYGKIWGDRAENFVEEISAGDKIRLDGNLQQYTKTSEEGPEEVMSNFTFFSWRPCTEKEAKELRAVFVLVGEVVAIDTVKEEETEYLAVSVSIYREPTEDREEREEIYLLYAELGKGIPVLLPGVTVNISGVMEQAENYFGQGGKMRPVIKELKVIPAMVQQRAGHDMDDEVPF